MHGGFANDMNNALISTSQIVVTLTIYHSILDTEIQPGIPVYFEWHVYLHQISMIDPKSLEMVNP